MMRSSSFEAERPRLHGIAVRILGSDADADDALQEAWLRYERTEGIDDVAAWLTTAVTRLCLDQLRRRSTRAAAEASTHKPPSPSDPEADALLAEHVADALQVVLNTLAPPERAAFVLHDVFGYPFDEISAVMGRSGTAVRQLASRARRKVHDRPESPQEQAAREDAQQVVAAFLAAARGGDLATLMALLAPDAVMQPDLAGQALGTGASFIGAEAVAARFNGSRGLTAVTLDGELGAAWMHAGSAKVAFVFHVKGDVVHEVELIADPSVLSTMEIVRVRKGNRGTPGEHLT